MIVKLDVSFETLPSVSCLQYFLFLPAVQGVISRPKDETKEEKRARKQVVKAERQARRVEKRETRETFSNEKREQLRTLANRDTRGLRKL